MLQLKINYYILLLHILYFDSHEKLIA